MTIHLQRNKKTRFHKFAWEYLVTIIIIKKYFIKAKAKHLKIQHIRFFSLVINTKLSLTQKYYKLITKNFIYTTTFNFYPIQK